MTPMSEWDLLAWAKIVACVLLLIGWVHQLLRGRRGSPGESARGIDLDPALLLVAVGALLPWREAIGDAIVLTGCTAWLIWYALAKLRR